MTLLIFIPARDGSKGIPKKNISKFGDKKLIDFTLQTAKDIEVDKKIFISTDSKIIADHCRNKDITVNYIRPSYLGQDDTSMIEVVLDGLNWMKENENFVPNEILLLQPTSPFRDLISINKAINYFYKKKLQSLFGVIKMNQRPEECIKKDLNNDKWEFLVSENISIHNQRQSFTDEYFFIDGSFYLSQHDFLKKYKTFIHKEKSQYYIFNDNYNIDIDEEIDLEVARALYFYRNT